MMVETQTSGTGVTPSTGDNGTAEDYLLLLKPRVMSLVLFTAFIGLVAAPGHLHPVLAFTALLAIALGAGASGALNMWYDADIDAVMRRTASRPIPRGAITPGEALGFGLSMAIASVVILGLCVNYVSAAMLAFTIFFYAVIYTMWLKRWTPQNIVIGGAAGAFPPMIGWSAVTGSIDLPSVTLFLIIFLWTPPHFWALALWREGDYGAAGIPMLPNIKGPKSTRRHILVYTLVLLPAAFLPLAFGLGGWIYGIGAVILSLQFLYYAVAVWRDGEGADNNRAAKKLFGFSIFWLFMIFALIPTDRLLNVVLYGAAW